MIHHNNNSNNKNNDTLNDINNRNNLNQSSLTFPLPLPLSLHNDCVDENSCPNNRRITIMTPDKDNNNEESNNNNNNNNTKNNNTNSTLELEKPLLLLEPPPPPPPSPSATDKIPTSTSIPPSTTTTLTTSSTSSLTVPSNIIPSIIIPNTNITNNSSKRKEENLSLWHLPEDIFFYLQTFLLHQDFFYTWKNEHNTWRKFLSTNHYFHKMIRYYTQLWNFTIQWSFHYLINPTFRESILLNRVKYSMKQIYLQLWYPENHLTMTWLEGTGVVTGWGGTMGASTAAGAGESRSVSHHHPPSTTCSPATNNRQYGIDLSPLEGIYYLEITTNYNDFYGSPHLANCEIHGNITNINFANHSRRLRLYSRTGTGIDLSTFNQVEEIFVGLKTTVYNLPISFPNLKIFYNYESSCITQVEVFKNVHTLKLYQSSVTDLSCLWKLTVLDLSYCKNVTDVSMLGKIKQRLALKGCIGILDVSALGNIPDLDLSHSLIQDISKLGNHKKLVLYNCKKIKDVSSLKNVKDLDCSQCPEICDITMLSNVIKLDISGDYLIDDLRGLSKIEELIICTEQTTAYHFKHEDLSSLSTLKKLSRGNDNLNLHQFHGWNEEEIQVGTGKGKRMKELEILDCNLVEMIANEQITILRFLFCPLLKEFHSWDSLIILELCGCYGLMKVVIHQVSSSQQASSSPPMRYCSITSCYQLERVEIHRRILHFKLRECFKIISLESSAIMDEMDLARHLPPFEKKILPSTIH